MAQTAKFELWIGSISIHALIGIFGTIAAISIYWGARFGAAETPEACRFIVAKFINIKKQNQKEEI